jgi:uncharacterized protein (TIGR02145 family)
MRVLLPLFIVLTISNFLFSQSLIIYKSGGLQDTVDIGQTDSILVAPFQCGINTIRYSGIIYHTVSIGSQCWLKENLNVGTRINGSSEQTNNGIIEKYCYNDDSANCTTYGGLYEWAEMLQYQNGATNNTYPNPAYSGNVKGICPTGWHIPTDAEFVTLSSAVGNDGNALKAVGQGTGAGAGTNTSGFSALLGGFRHYNQTFTQFGACESFWRLEGFATNPNYADSYFLYNVNNTFPLGTNLKEYGFSVRCIKD